MQKLTIAIFDCVTNELVTREMTDEEHAEYLEIQTNAPAPLFPHETPTSNP